MNQPHYHKHGWVKYDEVQREINKYRAYLSMNALDPDAIPFCAIDREQEIIHRLLNHIREGFDECNSEASAFDHDNSKALKEYEDKSLAILQEFHYKRKNDEEF